MSMSVIIGILIILVCAGIIYMIIRLIIALLKIALVVGLIVAVIAGINFLRKWLPYVWEHYILSDIGKAIMLCVIISIAGIIILRIIFKYRKKKNETEINADIFRKELAAGRLSDINRYVLMDGKLHQMENRN